MGSNWKLLRMQAQAVGRRFTMALVLAIPLIFHGQTVQADPELSISADQLLDVLAINTEEALLKGQRNTFQGIIDSYAKLPGVKAVALYPRSRLMNYRSGLVSVGKPFVHKDGKLENPNEDPYEATNGRFQREDWGARDMHESAEAVKHTKKEKKKGNTACDTCHYTLDENLPYDDRGRAKLAGGRLIQRYTVQESCIQCHDNWKPGEPAGYLELLIGKP